MAAEIEVWLLIPSDRAGIYAHKIPGFINGIHLFLHSECSTVSFAIDQWSLQIVNLNNSVGSTERCQGGFISPAIDDDSAGTDLEMSPELTSVDILDYTLTNHINFEVRPSIGMQKDVFLFDT